MKVGLTRFNVRQDSSFFYRLQVVGCKVHHLLPPFSKFLRVHYLKLFVFRSCLNPINLADCFEKLQSRVVQINMSTKCTCDVAYERLYDVHDTRSSVYDSPEDVYSFLVSTSRQDIQSNTVQARAAVHQNTNVRRVVRQVMKLSSIISFHQHSTRKVRAGSENRLNAALWCEAFRN